MEEPALLSVQKLHIVMITRFIVKLQQLVLYQIMMVQAAKKGVLHKLNAGKAQILFVKLQKQDQFLTETVVSVKMNIVVTLQIAS